MQVQGLIIALFVGLCIVVSLAWKWLKKKFGNTVDDLSKAPDERTECINCIHYAGWDYCSIRKEYGNNDRAKECPHFELLKEDEK